MSRIALLAGGLVLLVLAAVVTPRPPERAGAGLLQEVGRSLGGARVLVSDVLFLRADRLREEGRLEEVPALYAAVQDLEPENPAAADFLVAVQAFDLVADAPDAATRRRRWETAWDLVQRARQRYPDDPSLAVRAADLLLEVPAHHPDLAPVADATVGDRNLEGLELLLEAAEATGTLPRRGRHHLLVLSELIPALGVVRLATDEADPVLALGDRTLALRGDVLARMTWVGSPDRGRTFVYVPRDRYLRLGLEAVRELERRGPTARAEVRARLEAEIPGAPIVDALR